MKRGPQNLSAETKALIVAGAAFALLTAGALIGTQLQPSAVRALLDTAFSAAIATSIIIATTRPS